MKTASPRLIPMEWHQRVDKTAWPDDWFEWAILYGTCHRCEGPRFPRRTTRLHDGFQYDLTVLICGCVPARLHTARIA